MATTSGIITEIRTRNTKFGDMFDVHINGQAYGHGKYAPRDFKPGDFVSFEYEVKQNGNYTNYNITPRTMRKEQGGAPVEQSAPQTQTAVTASTGVQRVNLQDDRQKIISKQAALNTGLNLLDLMVKNGAIKIPAKAPDAYTLLNTLFAGYASRLYEINTGEKWDLTADDLTKVPAAKVPDADEFAEDELPDNM